ncbi:unnamed protein product [Discula destructiva]
MESSSFSKRRKTSPTTSVPVESTTPPDPPPHQARHQQQEQQPQSSPSRSPQRPSFASPTRSSLARHNPEILSHRRDIASRRPEDLPASEPNRPDEDVVAETASTAQSEPQSQGDGSAASPEASASASQPAATDFRSRSATVTSDVSRSPSRRVGGSTLGAQPARRTPTRPRPRPLPPPGPEEEELVANPFERRGIHRSPFSTGVLAPTVHEEPELPPTPEHPDPVVSTPPSGIHNTPSKRRRDPSERDAMRLHSSPSKHPLSQQVAGPEAPPQKESQKARGKRGASPVKIIGRTLTLPERLREPQSQLPEPRSEFAPGTHLLRSVRLRGPNWQKEQERDALRKQVAQLEADLELARRADSDAAEGLPLADKDGVLDLLRRHLAPVQEETERDSSTEWLKTVMDPIVMLGFNGFSAIHLPPVVSEESAHEIPGQPIISHHPIPMNASEELLYLQMFTPLTFTSSVATLSPLNEDTDQTIFQKHTINVRSASPPGLFTARIEMIVNTRLNSVTSLAVPRLDPAAASELRPFLESITNAEVDYHPVKTRNVNLLSWAMGEWYRIATQRARFWVSLEASLNSKDDLIDLVRSMRTRKKRRYRRQGQADDPDNYEGESLATNKGDATLFTKGRLLSHMGRTTMDFEIPCLKMEDMTEMSTLRVKWAVEFDWTGEARSKLGVELGVPGKWQAVDERKSISGIPKLFDKLLQGGEDPLMAVKTVVALLAGEPEA